MSNFDIKAFEPVPHRPSRADYRPSRNRRRNQNRRNKRSSGILVPSQPVTTVTLATNVGRPSRRGQRRRGRGGSTRKAPGYGAFKSDRISNPPAAVSGVNHATYVKQIGTPVHKEWGEGVRYQGCSLWGTVSPALGANSIWIPTLMQSVSIPGAIYYFDLYSAASAAYTNRVFSGHPGNISRIQRECANWGRYVYRKFMIHTEPCSTTDTNDGFVAGLGHDVSWPFTQGQFSSYGIGDIGTLGIHSTGALYEQAVLQANDYKGDRTWPCALPTVQIQTTSLDNPPPLVLAALAEDYYQYFFTAVTGALPAESGYRGLIYLSYVIDFYGVQSNSNFQTQPLIWNSGISSSGSLAKFGFVHTTDRDKRLGLDVPHKEEDKKSDLKSKASSTAKDEELEIPSLPTVGVSRVAPPSGGILSDIRIGQRALYQPKVECTHCGEIPCKADSRMWTD
jgi:hypothetical protein